jgi:carbon starvation protein
MNQVLKKMGWILFTLLGTIILGVFALHQGETINAMWLVTAAVMILFIGYRFYSVFISKQVMQLNAKAITPAVRFNDGLDYVPTNRFVLFGHHFAAIAGAGPLVGPVLAVQMGYLPGVLWILAGAIFAGAVQDFMVLVISMRNDGRSLGALIKSELGWAAGLIALFSTFMIMVIILAVLALIVVKALSNSPWSLFTVAATIPIGLFMGGYLRFIRPGQVGEVSLIGLVLLMAAIIFGQQVAESQYWAPLFTMTGKELVWLVIGYGFIASILPIWLLLAPRDYLSTFLKIGTIMALAVAILFVAPNIKMPALTQFIDGTGPVWSGSLFPFLFITIACGAVSGFHSLIASGTTPKMIENETHTRLVGYGGMLAESFVALMALITASCLEPGVYFAINSPPALIGTTVDSAAKAVSEWGFYLTPEMLTETAQNIGEKTILSRTGGAPTLAIGMAQVFSGVFDNKAMLAFWYHFAILFEALFILTAVDAGTRTGRFMMQDLLGTFFPFMNKTESWLSNIIATSICVAAWGYFLYQGVVDPLGGINTLWPLFGISNQMLAGIAFILVTVVLVKMKRTKYVWVSFVPLTWLLICTLTAGWEKIVDANPKIGFLAHAAQYQSAIDDGVLLAPASSIAQMRQIVVNDQVDAILALFFTSVVIILFLIGAFACWKASFSSKSSMDEPDLLVESSGHCH